MNKIIYIIVILFVLYMTLQIGRWWGILEKENEYQGWIEEQYKLEAQPEQVTPLRID